MEKTILLLLGILLMSCVQAQQLKFVQDELRMNYDDLGNIAVNDQLKLRNLYRPGKDFKSLESLGEPLRVNYRDHIAYESWAYTYSNIQLEYVNQNGYVQISSITLYPKESSSIKIGTVHLNDKARVQDIVPRSSVKKLIDKETRELKAAIYSSKGVFYKGVKLNISLMSRRNKIEKIQILFDTV